MPGNERDAAGRVALRPGGELGPDNLGERHRWRPGAAERPEQHGDTEPADAGHRKVGVVLERRPGAARRLGQCDPQLDTVQRRVVLRGRCLRVRDAAPGRHQVELARPDHLLAAQTVSVQHVPRQQPGHCLQPDMRVRRHAHPGDPVDRHRPVMVGEAPRAHAAPQPEGQQPPDSHVPDLCLARPCQLYPRSSNGRRRDLDLRVYRAHGCPLPFASRGSLQQREPWWP